jgi:ribosome-associated heat shock protein Hsp15
MAAAGRQRLDKWLWFARVVKTRTLAAKLVGDGHVRVNAVKVDAPAKAIGVGDVLTISLERQVRVLKVLGSGERRGPYEEARHLYEDLSPDPSLKDQAGDARPLRDAGSGRPTKRDRRQISAWIGRE